MSSKTQSRQGNIQKDLPPPNSRLFPWKLFNTLEQSETDPRLNKAISWLPDGRAFKIHKPGEFMTMFRSQSKNLRSFTRQLYLYGFSKINDGGHQGIVFAHPHFSRDDKKSYLVPRRNTASRDRRFSNKKQPKTKTDSSIVGGSKLWKEIHRNLVLCESQVLDPLSKFAFHPTTGEERGRTVSSHANFRAGPGPTEGKYICTLPSPTIGAPLINDWGRTVRGPDEDTINQVLVDSHCFDLLADHVFSDKDGTVSCWCRVWNTKYQIDQLRGYIY